jgi:hypothetical protein
LSRQAQQSSARPSFCTEPGSFVNAGRGRPQTSQAGCGTGANDARHASQIGTRLALVSNSSQIRHPAEKTRSPAHR